MNDLSGCNDQNCQVDLLQLCGVAENIIIRPYESKDRAACLEIFRSNCPPFFDPGELPLLERWLEHSGNKTADTPGYRNAEADYLYVLQKEGAVLGCGGFYVLRGQNNVRLAWGMVQRKEQKNGLGRML